MPLDRPERKKLLIVGGLIAFHFLVISIQVPLGEGASYLKRGVFFVLAPLEHAVQAGIGAVGRLWNRSIYLRDVERQNQAMRDELFHLRQENLRLRRGLEEFRDKEEVSRFAASISRSFVTASVIGVDAVNVRKSMIIGKGSLDGLRPNMPVLDGAGRLVGRMVEPIALHEGTVELVTSDSCNIGVVSERNKVVGILTGDPESGLCRLKYILSTGEGLEPDENLLTSGKDKIFPPGIPAGRIVAIRKTNALFKTVIVRPYLDLSRLSVVAVLTAAAGEDR